MQKFGQSIYQHGKKYPRGKHLHIICPEGIDGTRDCRPGNTSRKSKPIRYIENCKQAHARKHLDDSAKLNRHPGKYGCCKNQHRKHRLGVC